VIKFIYFSKSILVTEPSHQGQLGPRLQSVRQQCSANVEVVTNRSASMAVETQNASADVLDLLFDQEDGLLAKEHTRVDSHTVNVSGNMPVLDLNELETYNDLLNILENADLDTDISQPLSVSTDNAGVVEIIDHKYSRSPLTSDSGCSDAPSSPQFTDGTTDMSPRSGVCSSPSLSEEYCGDQSPLGGGM